MARVTVTVNGRSYDLACDDGQEAHVRELARSIDQRIARLVLALGQVGESRLLLLAALLIAHDLWEARKLAPPAGGAAIEEDPMILNELAALIDRVEAIADRLEAS